MSGHSHWAGIKHQKGIADQKRAKVFSKLLMAISAAVQNESNPDFNPRLRSAIQKAKEEKVPLESIQKAIKKSSEGGEKAEELLFEAYGPGGAAIFISVITSNRNRAVQEIKKILSDTGAKWAESGSVAWAFKKGTEPNTWRAKFEQELGEEDKSGLSKIVSGLEEHDDVQNVFTNAK